MQSSKNKEYTAADIERYHAGSMPAEQMHALEKAAMEDPFLADALEGYQFTKTPAADVQKIRERLNGNEKAKVLSLFQRIHWLRVAAAVLLLAGGTWLAIRLTSPGDTAIALQKKPAGNNDIVQQNKITPETFKGDSIQQSIVKTDAEKTFGINEGINQNKSLSPSASREREDATVIRKQSQTGQAEISKRKTEPIELPSSQVREAGKRMADSRQLQENARLSRSMPQLEEADRNRSQFENFMRDRAANQTEKEMVYAEKMRSAKTTDTIKNLNVVMQPSNEPAAEVVILSRDKAVAERKPVVIIDTLEPAEGRANFDDYIANNLKAPEEFILKSMNGGEVQLSFDVNNKGEAVNIAIVKSLCEACDAEAIRLLKEGPKWKKRKNAKGRITIRF